MTLMKANPECEVCRGEFVVAYLMETVPGHGPWISNNGKTYAEERFTCYKCDPAAGWPINEKGS